ncbi:MAG: 3-dehydroquinate synthase [Clostridiales bacterium]|nr:3-dehydroquinate synthase [Clostridiales bacterium]
MKIFKADTKSAQYPIYINDSFDGLLKAFEDSELFGRKAVIICDTNTKRLYLDEVLALLKDCFLSLSSICFEAGEERKNLDTIYDFYTKMTENKLDRKSVVIALGGGVVGDMAGFAAATYMRGITYVQIPTTLLSQVDSSVGGKTGVDFMGNKNLIGAFYQPAFVFMNSSVLKTLPPREVSAGMAEVIKHGYIIDREYLNMLNEKKEDIKALKADAVRDVLYGSCKAKSYVVSKDERETGLRAILNYGHTFGHAVETLLGFRLLHGECVAVGIMAALFISLERGVITEKDYDGAKALLEFFDLPVKVSGISAEEIHKQMYMDKKTKNNVITFVLLKKIGEAYTDKDVTAEEVNRAILSILGDSEC